MPEALASDRAEAISGDETRWLTKGDRPGRSRQPKGWDIDQGRVPGLTSLLNEHREAGRERHGLVGD